jgi:hypothetical protein
MSLLSRQFAWRGSSWRAAALLACVLVGACPLASAAARQDRVDRRQQKRIDEANRKEGEALLNLADTAMAGRPAPVDFPLAWRNDFLKAQPGTFVPFTISIDREKVSAPTGLMYIRAVRRPSTELVPRQARDALSAPKGGTTLSSSKGRAGQPALPSKDAAPSKYAFDAIFPVELQAGAGQPIRITRGFAVAPGEYDVYVALRERPRDPLNANERQLRAAVLKQPLSVPDFWTGELTTSTVMLANRLVVISDSVSADELLERPYVIGQHEVDVSFDGRFRRDGELVVVFLIYNPTVTPDKHFDLQVDYHLFEWVSPGNPEEPAKEAVDHPPARPGERYVSRTNPQRFNPSVMGGVYDGSADRPVMAGQGILLSSFHEGEYRIGITVTDLLSRKTLSRDVTFTVVGS